MFKRHFNSQPRKEADDFLRYMQYSPSGISTHSLSRRLTLTFFMYLPLTVYFNSQPLKEADRCERPRIGWKTHFNSQPLKEADGDVIVINGNTYISTHSLSRRLTPFRPEKRYHHFYFNSQPLKEADITGCMPRN